MTDCNSQRVIFAGTPVFAQIALEGLISSSHNVVAVLTQPDRRAGRGRKLLASPVKSLALEQGIKVMQPLSFKEESAVEALASLNADVMVVAAYGLILPDAVLSVPRFGCLNIHASLLPRWRGAAPIHRAIEAGDTQTGVCIMQMDKGLDTGDVLNQRSVRIGPNTTTAELHDELANVGSAALLETLPCRCRGEITPKAQPDTGVTYAHKIDKSEATLQFAEASAAALHRKVCAFNPWPVAETTVNGERLRVWRSELDSSLSTTAPPGTVLGVDERGVQVATKEGVLLLTELQRAGKKPMAAIDASRGFELQGLILGESN